MSGPAEAPAVVWLRDDLRITDNPALAAAVETGRPVVVLYVLDEVSPGIRPLGGASKWWLHHSLTSLAADLDEYDVPLLLRRGDAAGAVADILSTSGAGAVFWNRRYGGAERDLDARIKADAREAGLDAHSLQASLLFEPWTVRTGDGGPYTVFTPFWRNCQKREKPRAPIPAPETITAWKPKGSSAAKALGGEHVDDWGLLPTRPDWAGGLRERWTPGESAGQERLSEFVETIDGYADHRDEPAVDATSSLSPHLRWGEVSPFQVWHAVEHARRTRRDLAAGEDASKFLAEVAWREFCANLLYHWPDLATENFDRRFDAFPWREPEASELEAWRTGRTGIPLVDAGMRELWETGVMHNRIRMVTASFLIKNLLVDWRVGEAWFWDTLVDADAASNAANWQWVAGSGADASPYFRVFNPVTQSTKFDKNARYLARWLPELADLPPAQIHEPWKTGGDLLSDPVDYPEPIVDLKETRKRALDAFESVSSRPRERDEPRD